MVAKIIDRRLALRPMDSTTKSKGSYAGLEDEGRPALRRFHTEDIEKMRHLRAMGTSIRKLAKDFSTSQWMAAKLTSGVEPT
jgi:hypothetical protein